MLNGNEGNLKLEKLGRKDIDECGKDEDERNGPKFNLIHTRTERMCDWSMIQLERATVNENTDKKSIPRGCISIENLNGTEKYQSTFLRLSIAYVRNLSHFQYTDPLGAYTHTHRNIFLNIHNENMKRIQYLLRIALPLIQL